MSRFSAIVCDHCDVRDVLEHPPVAHVNGYRVRVTKEDEGPTDGNSVPNQLTNVRADLCESCYKSLTEAIFNLSHQVPRSAS